MFRRFATLLQYGCYEEAHRSAGPDDQGQCRGAIHHPWSDDKGLVWIRKPEPHFTRIQVSGTLGLVPGLALLLRHRSLSAHLESYQTIHSICCFARPDAFSFHFDALTSAQSYSLTQEPSILAGILWKGSAEHAPGPTSQLPKDTMAHPSTQPNLSPHFCFSSGTLRGKSSIDDSIAQNLNALVTPSRSGFDPSSTSQRAARPISRQIDGQACSYFKDKVLFPSWQARTEVLNYCALVAASPDPEDPNRTLRELEGQKDRERVVDERLDPYSARFFPREARTETLASLVRQERGVESIVRHRTWTVIKERCGDSADTWEDAAKTWKKDKDSEKPI
ncbi:hypothetical protein G7Z17_g10291 [Cylindrodendrum hubeiense]|uniref:Uncharacterized protein n=1 Tax=Cylindrodendrum hubeiense TaxID=595255 RepID=A0A9P5H549_9HYPO|nr:hypothetical protein G7Z17_g10291 [Cylindrodendrum hubeiense]